MKFKFIIVFGLLAFIAFGTSSQADFIQCVGNPCDGSNFADIINGSGDFDIIEGLNGDDVAFGNDDPDSVRGGAGNDFVFGGNGSDEVIGNEGNDILMAGPDDGVFSQRAFGSFDNDSVYTFASETSTCLFIFGNSGQDTAILVGFGPYSAQHPFGQTGWVDGWILEVDPIAGGYVLIDVSENSDDGTQTVHGLTSPNVTIISLDAPIVASCPNLAPPVAD